jgi:hypothetical protein
MKSLRIVVLIVAGLVLTTSHPGASGLVGIFGVIERVVFEPSEAAPERVQLWGAFAYADGGITRADWSSATRGYLYFALPAGTPSEVEMAKREWKDLQSVAGTPQAVGFGRWAYVGWFDGTPNLRVYPVAGGSSVDLRVRPASEAPVKPAPYHTNVGVVRIAAEGSYAQLVAQLRAALKK